MDDDVRNKVLAGSAVVVLGLGFAMYQVNRGDDATGCALSAAGVGAVASALSRGRTTDEVLKIAGPFAAGAACKKFVENLVDGESGTLVLQDALGAPFETQVTLPELTAPVPAAPPDGSVEALQCLRHDSAFLAELCFDGTIGPPP